MKNLYALYKRSLHNNFNTLGINERNATLIYPNNERKYYKLADDKVLTLSIKSGTLEMKDNKVIILAD